VADRDPYCPEAELRASMTDDEFWAHVFPQVVPESWDLEPSDIDADDMAQLTDVGTCPECGQFGACAYDAEGRPLLHAIREEP
jgi:hypothetical protein